MEYLTDKSIAGVETVIGSLITKSLYEKNEELELKIEVWESVFEE